METANTQTDLTIAFEAAAGCEEAEAWWAEGVSRRQGYSAVVEAIGEGRGCGGTAKGEMPFEDVVFEGVGGIICRWVLGQFGGFFH